MAPAVRFDGLLRVGTVRNYVELARLRGVSRARIAQILNLRNLALAIQEKILSGGREAPGAASRSGRCAASRGTRTSAGR